MRQHLCVPFVFFVLFVVSSPLHAVSPYQPVHPDPVLEPWRWTHYPELRGLGLRCMAEDKEGRIWFGVDDGVLVYDGVTWTEYTESDGVYGSPVNALCAGRDGSMYVGTQLGICQWKGEAWSRVFPEQHDVPWIIRDIAQASDGSLWAGARFGLIHVTRDGIEVYIADGWESALRSAAPEARITVVPSHAVPSFDPSTWGMASSTGILVGNDGVIFTIAPGGPGERAGLRRGDHVVAVDGASSTGTGWLAGTPGASATLMVVRAARPEPFDVTVTHEQGEWSYPHLAINDICLGRDGILWLGTVLGEILRCEPLGVARKDSTAWRLFGERDGLDVGSWARVLQTDDGTIWTVSRDARAGVNRFDGKTWTYSREWLNGSNNNPSILQTRDGTLWIGGYSRLHACRNGAWTPYKRPDQPVPGPYVVGLLEASDGALWVAGEGQEAVRLDLGPSRWATYEGLLYQCETRDGVQWFLSDDDGAVCHDRGTWTRYGVEDGLMEAPSALIATRDGAIWATGSHDVRKYTDPPVAATAATARFDGERWHLRMHPTLSWSVDWRTAFEAADGSLWFGASASRIAGLGQLGGVLRFDGSTWTHYAPPEAPATVYGIGQTADGILWFGGGRVYSFDGRAWSRISEPEELAVAFSDVVHTGRRGDLWIGHRQYGAFHNDGGAWTRFGVQDGLPGNRVIDILEMRNGRVWIATDSGICSFDGRSWTPHAFLSGVVPPRVGNLLNQSGDGAIWLNNTSGIWVNRVIYTGRFKGREEPRPKTVRYAPDIGPPETEIALAPHKVSQPGNTTLAWKGADPWKSTPDKEIQYAWRMDPSTALGAGSGEWSAFSHETNHIFELLPSGTHTFEVKARDRDLNEDPTPASVTFTVLPPVWQEPWFIGLMVVLLAAIGFQTGRVIRRDRRLRESNVALSDANRELFRANVELDRERAVERVRAEVTGMTSVDDLRGVVEEMLKELSSARVDFNLCVINIIDEEAGTRTQYGATQAGWAGEAVMPLAEVSDEFMAIYRSRKTALRAVDDVLADRVAGTWERSGVEGQPVRPTALVDVPFTYGTLSLSKRSPGGFGETDVALLEEFARVLALGYARFLDFQRVEAQNRELQRERAVEHVRAHVQSMERASDFDRMLSLLSEDMRAVGLSFDTCAIDVLDEPEEEPTMALFEAQGFRYTAYTIQPDGTVTRNAYHIPEPFPPVNLEMIQRFIAGQPWQGRSGGTAIVEVPAAGYGRLRLTAPDRETFTEEDVEALEEFAAAIALGYARYLDFQQLEAQNRALETANREIQTQTERKSRFLSSMSHELRTPMNAIIGFTRMVIRRTGDILPERQKENLSKVVQSGEDLLAKINDLLDLSKIEAGRMDVTAERFDVKTLVAGCCAGVEPLVAEKVDVVLNTEVSEDVGGANTDAGRLRQIVTNLLSNAIKFTDAGEIGVRARREGGELVIVVSDTGAGIPAEALDTVFEEFQQVRGSDPQRKGTGLGLPITKGFAELLGGSISVESEVGKGSVFTVRLPMDYQQG